MLEPASRFARFAGTSIEICWNRLLDLLESMSRAHHFVATSHRDCWNRRPELLERAPSTATMVTMMLFLLLCNRHMFFLQSVICFATTVSYFCYNRFIFLLHSFTAELSPAMATTFLATTIVVFATSVEDFCYILFSWRRCRLDGGDDDSFVATVVAFLLHTVIFLLRSCATSGDRLTRARAVLRYPTRGL